MLAERRQIIRIIRHLPKDKLTGLLKYAEEMEEELTPEEIAALEASEAQIARGEYVDFEELCRRAGL
ncbi:hypothetical protein [Sporolituus thermophilus]|uniref:Addiction module component n=1 Tax=Sporolituus thermophilus DSM 23256 TaxID=1123285 RepID=A0A1G7JY40_9FIRM|nr:hypothetical protein [Sporolituus thermophilus]SDF29469.1 hypothetical protein SAMN05660235_01098 [Sporolituus thermophilus DSM 23256]